MSLFGGCNCKENETEIEALKDRVSGLRLEVDGLSGDMLDVIARTTKAVLAHLEVERKKEMARKKEDAKERAERLERTLPAL